jgi:hypothetical protein
LKPRLERLEARVNPGFLAPLPFDAGSLPVSVAVGDFNGDGIPDLAVANNTYPNGTVSVLLGKGDGTFLTAVTYAAGTYPRSVAVGDFNGDGIPDLAVANEGTSPSFSDSSVSILLGKGDGTFLPAVNYAAGAGRRSVAVGDFNGDGKLDLAVAGYGRTYNYPYGWTPTDETVRVLLGNGDGTFQAPIKYDAGYLPTSVAVADFNGDGKLDLAVANYNYPGTVSVLLGNGSGGFGAPTSYPVGANPHSVAVGDFNGDGIPDLAVANQFSNNVSVLLGKGDGTFLPAQSFPAGFSPNSVAVGDFNGDGKLDLAVVVFGGVSVLLGKGDGTFLPAQSYATGSGFPSSVAVGDFNGDGAPDLAVASPYLNDFSILLNDATWAGGPGRASSGPSHPPVPERLPPPTVLPLPAGEEPLWAGSALLAVGPPPGNGTVAELAAPLSLSGAEPPQTAVLPVLPGEGRPPGLAETPAWLRARGVPGGALDRLFAELAANGLWDDRTDRGTPLLT